MYKLILVDDETEMREGLKEVIPFEKLGFTVVGEASNGVEALQLCEQQEPDLVITDIRMPLMDGLTLCRKAHALLPTIQCIILSGYDDFEYARQAIEIKTMGYLLKPISSGDFVEMLQKTRAALDEDFARRKDETRLREHFRESMPVLREALLSSLLSDVQTPERVLERAQKYDMRLDAPFYALALFRATSSPSAPPDGDMDEELRLFAMRNILCEALEDDADSDRREVFTYGGMIAILYMLSDASDERAAKMVQRLDEARKTARYYLGCQLYVGVSGFCDQLSRLPACARQALTVLNQCMLGKEEQVLCFSDLQRRECDDLAIDEALLNTLSNGVKTRDAVLAHATLHKLMDAARNESPSPRAWQAYLMEILMCFLRVVSEQALAWDTLDEQLDELTQHILHACPSVSDAESELSRLLDSLLSAVESRRQTSGKLLASEAERYLQENYSSEDTTLEQLCLHLHISPSYFSMVFKKETKKTFHQYLTDLRMDKALTLLSSGDMKVSQIAESVGLPDPSYFSYCFKKYFGYPPSRTRNR